uniref:Uncharacterized protein n=1 Tax=Plectus sambesii TaxID=2011161 RepID=A0A914V0D6_9BILA
MLFTSGLSKVVEEYGPTTGCTRTAEETKRLATDKRQLDKKPRLVRRHTDMNLGKKHQVLLADLDKDNKSRSSSTGRGKQSLGSRWPTVDSATVRAELQSLNLPFLRSKHSSFYRQRTADKLNDVPEGEVVRSGPPAAAPPPLPSAFGGQETPSYSSIQK